MREFLRAAYRHRRPVCGAGIATMPSRHVATSELNAIIGRQRCRTLGVLLTSFAVVTFVGSVALGAHYSIDGILSILVVHALWHVCRTALAWNRPGLAVARCSTALAA